MNKGDLVDAVAGSTGAAKSQVESVLTAALGAIQDAVRKGEKVTLPGFGTFERRERAARPGRNPQTGATIRIKATKAPVFKAGATFKAVVSGARKTAPAKKAPAKKAPAKKAAAKKSPAKKR